MKKKETILFLLNNRVSYLPPFQALIDSLLETGSYKLIVVSSEFEPEIDNLYKDKDIEFIHYYKLEPHKGFWPRVRNKLKTNFVFKMKIYNTIKNIKYDYLWIIHEKTAVLIPKLLKNRKYIVSSYELNDTNEVFKKKFRNIAQNAKVNIACEENRAWMMKVWYNLREKPFILPNKPYTHPRKPNLGHELVNCIHDKIILYQGIIERERNLEGICEAASRLNGYKLVLMGSSSDNYVEYLYSKYKNVQYIGYVKSPFHLQITSHAHIGIVTYAPDSLNLIYCAPNKIWEYSGFGIPMIANEIPGLKNTVEKCGAGICINTDDPSSIIEGVKYIEKNYQQMHLDAIAMYENCNITQIIESILNRYNQ